MQRGSSAGLRPASASERRCTIECIHNAKQGFEDKSLIETWATKTPAQAHAVLAAPDVMVTNLSDKEARGLFSRDRARAPQHAAPRATARAGSVPMIRLPV